MEWPSDRRPPPTGTRDDPIHVRPGGSSRADKRWLAKVVAVVVWLVLTVGLYGDGHPVLGTLVLVGGGAALVFVLWIRGLDPNQPHE